MGDRFDKYYEAIDIIEDNLRKDLIGPVNENEVLVKDMPLDYYVCGVLWPQRSSDVLIYSKEDIDDIDDELSIIGDKISTSIDDLEDTTGDIDDSISASNKYKPSAMGITVMLRAEIEFIDISFRYGKYIHKEIYKEIVGEDDEGNEETKSIPIPQFTRVPKTEDFTMRICRIEGVSESRKFEDFSIQCNVRKILENGDKLVTISVVNAASSGQKHIELNRLSLFQCELEIKMENNTFIPLYNEGAEYLEEEDLINSMLYSEVYNYAYGHGCSVTYDDSENKVAIIKSDFMPSAEVFQMMPGSLKEDTFLSMFLYKTQPKETMILAMCRFLDEYKKWYNHQKYIGQEMYKHIEAVKISLERIRVCINRIENGIKALDDENTYKAFAMMNEAMCLQRVKSKEDIQEVDVKWYPFQIAYVLQIIPDILNPQSKYRNSVDLLWFPTGGGKTEAYLGVAAFTIFHRRLTNNIKDDGVAILMRYTLRLLTIQQFERATALICACEFMRKKYKLDGGEINIGLWIGSNMTPNHTEKAREVIRKLSDNKNEKIYEGNPLQITTCPWCKSEIDVLAYTFEDTMKIKCPDESCAFHNGLPIYLIDDDVYKVRPTLVLSTVDKFARIVWEPRAKSLFGERDGQSIELIIQDELHLISGPLGSISGIYELVITKLCEREGVGAKVIASTATVRNAKAQVKNLYNKESIQFPPNGISANDSFFAIKANKNNRPARRYMGVCENGGSVADLLIRVYANLAYSKLLFQKMGIEDKIIDQYYTTVGYFNAIKDLGASSSIISDRMKVSLRALINHKFKAVSEDVNLTISDIKRYDNCEELTSRKTSKEIKDTLSELEKSFPDARCFEYILASNMLSVGIDINRLGVLTMYNQPKSNAEYIQATSRVGRSNPGLVLAMYNAMRSRDKSYYEQFPFYHKTMYQYVEATSVTPFSLRAMEKALHSSFTALVRHLIPDLNENEVAYKFRNNIKGVVEIKKYMIDVISNINPEVVEDASFYLELYSQRWEQLAKENHENFPYKDYNGEVCLLQSAEKENNINLPTTLNALRNVEDSSNVYILRREV